MGHKGHGSHQRGGAALFDGSSPYAATVLVALCVAALLALVAYVVYRVRGGDMTSVVLVDAPVRLTTVSTPIRVDRTKIPPTLNGQEFTYTFWTYLVDVTPSAQFKLLWLRGGDGSTVTGASPVVFLDANTNKMYVSCRTNLTTDVTEIGDLLSSGARRVDASIDYVPMQRWVHVAIVQKDDALTLFVDGAMYTIASVQDLVSSGGGGRKWDSGGRGGWGGWQQQQDGSSSSPPQSPQPPPSSITDPSTRPVFKGTSGDVIVGPLDGSGKVDGFLARLQFFNYALAPEQIKVDYDRGPASNTVLAAFGLSQYGLRSPIYRVD